MKQQRALLGVRTKAYDAQLEIHDDQNNVTQDKPTTQQFGFDNITAGRGWRYHIASTKQTCPGVIHACCSYPSSWEQQIWVKWNLFLWVCVCVVTTLPAEKKNHLTVQLSESVSTLPASEDQFPASPPMLKMAAEVELWGAWMSLSQCHSRYQYNCFIKSFIISWNFQRVTTWLVSPKLVCVSFRAN